MKMSEYDKLKLTPITRGEMWLARKVAHFNTFQIDISPSHDEALPPVLPPIEKMVYYTLKLKAAFAVEGYKIGDAERVVDIYKRGREIVLDLLDEPREERRRIAAARYREKHNESD